VGGRIRLQKLIVRVSPILPSLFFQVLVLQCSRVDLPDDVAAQFRLSQAADVQEAAAHLRSIELVPLPVLDQETAEHVALLWRDAGIQAAYSMRTTFQLPDSASYLFDRVLAMVCLRWGSCECLFARHPRPRVSHSISLTHSFSPTRLLLFQAKPDYVPSTADVLRMRVRTTGVVTLPLTIKGKKFQIIDVGGQRSERKKVCALWRRLCSLTSARLVSATFFFMFYICLPRLLVSRFFALSLSLLYFSLPCPALAVVSPILQRDCRHFCRGAVRVRPAHVRGRVGQPTD
jgi:hypothetical protein